MSDDTHLIPLALRFVADSLGPLRTANDNMRHSMVQARLKGATDEQIAEAAQTSAEAVVARIGAPASQPAVVADLTAVLVSLSTLYGSGDPEDAYEHALHDVAGRMGIDLQAALEASVPILPPLERTDLTPWRDGSKGERP